MIDIENTEQSILQNIIRFPELLGKLKLKPDMFQDYEIKNVISFILESSKVDQNEIVAQSKTNKNFIRLQYLSDIMSKDITSKGHFMNDQINLLNNYVLNSAMDEASQYIKAPSNSNFNNLINQISELNDLSIKKENPTKKYIEEFMNNVFSENKNKFIKTGFKSIDSKIKGFERGQLNVLAGRPSTGKSALALNMVLNLVKDDYPVTFFSLETGGVAVTERLASTMSGIDLTKVKDTDMLSVEEIEKLSKVAGDMANRNNLRIEDTSILTPNNVREIAMQKSDKPNIIFIDYLTLMQSDTPQKDRRLEVEKIARDLKIIAKETDSVIIALSQLSRGVESRQDKRPMMSDLKEAGGIESDANVVFLLYREDYYNQELADNETGKSEIEVNVAKNKDGETGIVNMEFYKKNQRFFNA